MTTDQYERLIAPYSSNASYGVDPGDEDYTAFYNEAIDPPHYHDGFVDELSQVIHGRKTDPDGKVDYLPVNNFISERYFELVQEEQKIRQFTSPRFGLVELKKGNFLPEKEKMIETFFKRATTCKKPPEWIMNQIQKFSKNEDNKVKSFLEKSVHRFFGKSVDVRNNEKGDSRFRFSKRYIPLKIENGILYSDRKCIMKFEPSWCAPEHAMCDIAKQFLKDNFGLDIDSKPKEKSFHTFIIQSLRKRLIQIREEMEKEVVNLDDNHLQCLFLSRKYLFKHLTSLFEMKKDFQFRFKHFTEINAVSGKKVYKKEDFEALKKYYSKGDKKRPLYKGGHHIDDYCGDGEYGYPVTPEGKRCQYDDEKSVRRQGYHLLVGGFFWYYTDKDNKTHRFRFLNSFDYRALREVVEKNKHIIQNFLRKEEDEERKKKECRKKEEEERKKKREEKKEQKRMDDKIFGLYAKFKVLYDNGVFTEEDIDAFDTRLKSKIDKFDKKRKRAAVEEDKAQKKRKVAKKKMSL